jgi:hypothetical protein
MMMKRDRGREVGHDVDVNLNFGFPNFAQVQNYEHNLDFHHGRDT